MKRYALSPGAEIILLELVEYQGERAFADCRSPARKALSPPTVNVKYTDIYNSVMPFHRKPLSWFDRHAV